MQLDNIINLDFGINKIEIDINDLGIECKKMPLAIIPKGCIVSNMAMVSFSPFKSSLIDNQTNDNSCIKARIAIGDSEDSELFLSRVTDTPIGTVCSNTGSYFDNPVVYNTDKTIYLESWISQRVWTIQGNLSTARSNLAGCGTQYAGLSFGGHTGSTYVNTTEEYNGSSWGAGGNLNTARYDLAGAGTQTAGVSFGGYTTTYSAVCEKYNGTSWTASGSLNTARDAASGCGIQDASLCVGGETPSYVATTEEYNGTSWTFVNTANLVKSFAFTTGFQDAALSFGGYDGIARLSYTEEYNGIIWTIVNSLNFGVSEMAGFGDQSSSVYAGGRATGSVYNSFCEEYDGIIWFISNNKNEANKTNGGCGTSNSGLTFGGYNGIARMNQTEEYINAIPLQLSIFGSLSLNITIA